MMRTANIPTALLVTLLTGTATADTTLVTTPLPGGTSAVGAFTLAGVYGQATTLDTMSAGTVLLEPGFLCVEADDLPIPGDLNNDGLVNGIDLAVVLGTWGACGSGSCVADINRDGLVNGADLSIVLSNWG
jgi:hypothetical protein